MQFVVNTCLLRELDERKLINRYAKLMCETEEDFEDEIKIRQNLEKLLDWDINGDNGLGLYCGRFESLKKKDMKFLIDFIKKNSFEIKNLSYAARKEKRLENKKIVLNWIESKINKEKEYYTKEDYTPSKRGLPAKPCEYKGKIYKSRHECQYKEGISQSQLYRYLEKTGQV